VVSLQSDKGRDRLHRIAQAAHCAAQGKVGSGFDVASAVYGSCIYQRFSPKLLEGLGTPGSSGFGNRLRALVDAAEGSDEWDAVVIKNGAKLPNGLRLAICDVDCGSQTPGMVKKVLSWRSKEPDEADMLWRRLHQANQGVAKALAALVANEGDTHIAQSSEKYEPLAASVAVIREMIRDMSRLSDVPIEPDEQSRLLDACSKVEGVVGGVVPGAGGYDAISLLMEDSKEAVQRLKECLDEWNSKKGDSEGNTAGKVSLLKVREDDKGIRLEDPAQYRLWIVKREDSRD
jgi:phosphomevalonate kinase